MKFEKNLQDLKNIDWQYLNTRNDSDYWFSKQHTFNSLMMDRSLQKMVNLFKELGYERKEIPRPHDFKPKDFFIPNEQLFTEQEQQEVDNVISSMEFNNEFGLALLQWAKMCDKGYDITKDYEELYDGLLFALKQGVITRRCSERMLVIGAISTPFTAWPEPYYSKITLIDNDKSIEKVSKEIEEEEKAKGSEAP